MHRITNTVNIMCNRKGLFFIPLASTDNSGALHCDNGLTMIRKEWKIEESEGRRSIFLQALNQSSGRHRADRSSKLWMCDACSYTLGMFAGSRSGENSTLWNFNENFCFVVFCFFGGGVISSAVYSLLSESIRWDTGSIDTVQAVDIKDGFKAALQHAKLQLCA